MPGVGGEQAMGRSGRQSVRSGWPILLYSLFATAACTTVAALVCLMRTMLLFTACSGASFGV